MIKIRKLEMKDIPFMLEWMHDDESKRIFQYNFSSVSKEEASNFIVHSFDKKNQHFAIVDDLDDEYLGTISLKNIDYKNMNAEYAISTRKKTRGTGINIIATKLILEYAFKDLQLNKVYLNVLKSNKRAIHFYQKIGFIFEGSFKNHVYVNGKFQDLEWYSILRGNYHD